MPIFTTQTYRSTLAALVFSISAAAGAALLWWGSLPYAGLMRTSGEWARWSADGVFFLDWMLMCTAMMLPTAMPLLAAVQRTTSRCKDSPLLLAVCALGFLGVWLVAGVVVRMGENGLQQVIAQSPWFFTYQQQVFAGLLALSGIYLLTPVAHNCVSACRSPIGFIARNWTGRPDVNRQVARIGIQYGWSCFGCCWPLMVVMCALGMSNPLWMLLLTLVMLLQKQNRYGYIVTYVSGGTLLIWAMGLAIGWVNMPLIGIAMCSSVN
jgi:predicted metal-binding membrane protein